VVFSSFLGALFSRKAKIITTVHGVYPDKVTPIVKIGLFCFKPLACFILKRSCKVIALSKKEKSKLVKIFKVSPSKIKIIPPGIEIKKPSLKIQHKLKKNINFVAIKSSCLLAGLYLKKIPNW